MKKIFWLGIGIAVGALTVRKISATRAALGPEGLNRAVGRLSDSIHNFAEAVREGMDEREADLRVALGVGRQAARRRRGPAPGGRHETARSASQPRGIAELKSFHTKG